MRIFKQYKGKNSKTITTKKECLEHTENSGYWKKGTVLSMLAMGLPVQTPFATYFTEDRNT